MRDALIVGGGLSGTAAALGLARKGLSVHLLEAQRGAVDKPCGEFLSIEAQDHLRALGLDLDAFGASQVHRIRLVAGGRMAEATLPFIARGLSRRRLDEGLIELAEAAGVHIERPVRALELVPGGVRTGDGERTGKAVLLATGKIGLRTDHNTPTRNAHIGFKMHWRTSAAVRARLDQVIELALFPGGYAGLQLVEEGVANLCLVLRRDRLASLGGRWEDVLAMVAPLSPCLTMLADCDPLFARPATVANLPYGRIHAPKPGDDRIYRLGDQAAMTASLTGDGMAIALRSGWLAAECLGRGESAQAYHARLRATVGGQVRRGMLLQRLAETPRLPAAAMGILRACPALLRSMVRMTRLPGIVEECE